MTATLYRKAALADATSARLVHDISVLVVGGRIAWIRPVDEEGPLPASDPPAIIDAHGSTIVPGLVDAHAHLTLPGGASWIARIDDPVEDLLAAAEHNARLLGRAGVRWIRDVGSPRVARPGAAGERALALDVRDRWRGRPDVPYIRAAGTWLMRSGTLATPRTISVERGDELLAAAALQLDDGADLLKLYLDGPEPGVAPWTVAEVEAVVALAHGRGARVTGHSGGLEGASLGVRAGIDAIEHGFVVDEAVAAEMARRGTFLVSTLTVFRSWQSFAPDDPPAAVHRAGGAGPDRRTARACRGERPDRPGGRRPDRGRHRLRRRLGACQPAGVGGRVPRRGGPGAVGGAGRGDMAWWGAPRRARGGPPARGRPGRPRAGARRPAQRSVGPVAGLARRLARRRTLSVAGRRGEPAGRPLSAAGSRGRPALYSAARAISSVGQSARFTSVRSLVRAQYRPPRCPPGVGPSIGAPCSPSSPARSLFPVSAPAARPRGTCRRARRTGRSPASREGRLPSGPSRRGERWEPPSAASAWTPTGTRGPARRRS